ncbi:hypothetical protein TSAR_004499 [Trichomalopsis sarcophagae]|uniref:Uncharacterized protein n=1 Tax=Trichomalopsis sarcophagae TaxID=543379 RepID=A0A232EXU5_9HYME|nr:hypothetical protein TSAR_004499 [Trichomalopsis sarcophagae]
MCVCACVYVYPNISGSTWSLLIKFEMHVYFWILNSGKTFFFYFSNYFLFYGQFLIFKKHYFAFFQSSHRYKQFS